MFCGLILFVALSGALANLHCPGGKLTPEIRQQIVDTHNKYRSELAHGKTKGKDGLALAGAKNMLEMSWNCELEKTGQKWSDYCKFEHSSSSFNKGSGENLFAFMTSDPTVLKKTVDQAGAMATADWWNEVKKYNVTANPKNWYTAEVYSWGTGHFTQMAWAKTFQVGCGIAVCESKSMLMVTCEYWPSGNWIGLRIYENGKECARDSECRSNKCNEFNGLCINKGGPVYGE